MNSLFQAMPLYDCQLAAHRIDVWQFSLKNLPHESLTFLETKELAQANRFYFKYHKRRFMVARTMLRLILSRYVQIAPQDLNFTYNKYGKPTLVNNQQLEFNLSHSEELALLAIGQQYPLGVDLEFFSARPYQGIAKHLFSEQERDELRRLPASFKALAFFNIWSQKEAFIKACGMGLSYPTEQFSINAIPSSQNLVFDNVHQRFLALMSFMPTVSCSAALCYNPDIQILRKIILPNNYIL